MQTEEMAFSLNPSRNHKVVMAPVHKSNINRSLRLAVVVMVANRSLNPKCKVVVVAVTVMGVIDCLCYQKKKNLQPLNHLLLLLPSQKVQSPRLRTPTREALRKQKVQRSQKVRRILKIPRALRVPKNQKAQKVVKNAKNV